MVNDPYNGIRIVAYAQMLEKFHNNMNIFLLIDLHTVHRKIGTKFR